MLQVHDGLKERSFLPEEKWLRILSGAEKAAMASVNDDPPQLQVLWNRWHNGQGLIACQDNDTMMWYKNYIKDNFTARGWLEGERDVEELRYCTLVARYRYREFPGEQILAWMKKAQTPPIPGTGRFLSIREC